MNYDFSLKSKKRNNWNNNNNVCKKIAQINGILSKLHHYVPQKT